MSNNQSITAVINSEIKKKYGTKTKFCAENSLDFSNLSKTTRSIEKQFSTVSKFLALVGATVHITIKQ